MHNLQINVIEELDLLYNRLKDCITSHWIILHSSQCYEYRSK